MGFSQGYKGAQSVSEVTLVFSSTSVAFRQGLALAAWGSRDSTRGREWWGADAENAMLLVSYIGV